MSPLPFLPAFGHSGVVPLRWIAATGRMLLTALLLPSAAAVAIGSASAAERALVYVDQTSPAANDSNPGTSSAPLETIARAVEIAEAYNAESVPVDVIIEPGVYRESIQLSAEANATPSPITLNGARTGVVMSGSDIWEGWAGGDGIYRHAWPYDWGFAPVPSEWPEYVHAYLGANSIIRRQEMVFIDGRPLLQVTSLDEMNSLENSFFVSEESDQIVINIPSETEIAASRVEVAIRPNLLVIDSRQNISIENVTFQHTASPLQGAAVRIVRSENVSVMDARFVWNNSRGLGMSENRAVTIQGASAIHNGISGFTGYRIHELRVVNSEASYNGWRGARGWDRYNHASAVDANFIDFATGQKFFRLRNASFHNYRAVGNLTGGLWLDFDNSGVVLDGLSIGGNMTHGLFLEASQGPISVVRSHICHNETGVLIGNASNVRLADNVIAGNELGQVYLVGTHGPRFVDDHVTGNQLSVQTEDLVIERNTIAVDDATFALATVLKGDLWFAFVRSVTAQHNRYSSPKEEDVFQLPGARSVSLGQWRAATGTDAGSTFSKRYVGCSLPAGIIETGEERAIWFLLVAVVSACVVATPLAFVAYRRRRRRRTGA
jgi:Right handed beta helix region